MFEGLYWVYCITLFWLCIFDSSIPFKTTCYQQPIDRETAGNTWFSCLCRGRGPERAVETLSVQRGRKRGHVESPAGASAGVEGRFPLSVDTLIIGS